MQVVGIVDHGQHLRNKGDRTPFSRLPSPTISAAGHWKRPCGPRAHRRDKVLLRPFRPELGGKLLEVLRCCFTYTEDLQAGPTTHLRSRCQCMMPICGFSSFLGRGSHLVF